MRKFEAYLMIALLITSIIGCSHEDLGGDQKPNFSLVTPSGVKIADSMEQLIYNGKKIMLDKYGEEISFKITNIEYPYLNSYQRADYAIVHYTTAKGTSDSFLAYPTVDSNSKNTSEETR